MAGKLEHARKCEFVCLLLMPAPSRNRNENSIIPLSRLLAYLDHEHKQH